MPNYDKKTKKILEDNKIIDRNPEKAVIDETPNAELRTRKKRGGTIKQTRKKAITKVKNKLKNVPVKHIEWMREYLKTGKPTEAFTNVYGEKNPYVAGTKAGYMLKKYGEIMRSVMIDALGATERYFLHGLVEMTKANKSFYTKKGGIAQLPDNKTRISAYKLLGEYLKVLGTGTTTQNIDKSKNVIIVKDESKGVFSIGEEEQEIQEAELV